MVYRKGQLSADFYVALIIFIGFLSYVTFQMFQTVPANANTLKDESLRIDAYQISELLINDGGQPNDWNARQISDVQRIGLSDASRNLTNLISRAKLDQLKNICVTGGDFQSIAQKLDIKNTTSITFIEHATHNDIIWICKSPVTTNKKTSFNVSRTVSIDGTSFGELVVEAWRS
ncbi:MAG: hypothetical protein HYW23_00765 [Candidatus Aenigmarchaeota archaeon]|nr:hypothetical protein [Candidatus Aenigmarchaeota archaeon]